MGLHGLDHHTTYDIYLKATPVDEYRYKFLDMQWVALGESEVRQYDKRQIYKHPNSPKSGSFWMKKPISFKPCKITHNPLSKHGNVSLLVTKTSLPFTCNNYCIHLPKVLIFYSLLLFFSTDSTSYNAQVCLDNCCNSGQHPIKFHCHLPDFH